MFHSNYIYIFANSIHKLLSIACQRHLAADVGVALAAGQG